MDLNAVRTVVAVADAGQFQQAAADLAVTQQAVSKRVAALERELGVRLFTRTAQGARPTADGRAFLPHARELLRAAERAAASVRRGRRALRVDVIGRRLAPAGLLRDFHREHPDTALDVVTLFDAATAVAAVRAGTVDASFRAVTAPPGRLPDGVAATRVDDEPIELLVGPGHAFASAPEVAPRALAGHRIWMPGIVSGTEWAAYYAALADTFGLTIDSGGPHFGMEPVLDALAGDGAVATLVGQRTELALPAGRGLRRVPVRHPVPVYPHSLLWHRDNPHPALALLRDHLSTPPAARHPAGTTWTPEWTSRRTP